MIFRTEKNTRRILFRIVGSLFFVTIFVFSTDIIFRTHLVSSSAAPESYIDYYQEIVADNKVVALTFDDGPNPKTTLQIAQILKENNVPGTFFFMGGNALKHPHIVKEVHGQGFEIGNHTFSHSRGVHSSRSRIEFELNATNNILESITGETPILYRPPFLLDIGADPSIDIKDQNKTLEFVSSLGYVVVGADVDSKDWLAHSSDEVVTHLLSDISSRGGHIVLLHDGFSGKYTVEALPSIIQELRAAGYEFTSVSNILGLSVVGPRLEPSLLDGLISSIESSISYFFIYFVAESNNALSLFIKLTLWLFIFRCLFILILFVIKAIKGQKRFKTQSLYRKGVSVVIPVHNEAENIAATVTSVLDNSYKNIEIIIVDDGSTDNTALIGEWVRGNYPRRISLIKIPNGGKANALNVGIREARHEIVIGMDGDTIFHKDAIKFLVQHFDDSRVSGVAGKIYAANPWNLLGKFQEIEYIVSQNIDKEAFNTINAVGVIPGAIGAWRKSDLLALGGYSSDTLAEDQDLTLALLAADRKVVYEPRAISYTETPYTVGNFLKQRFRWLFGTVQCLWKYKRHIFNPDTPSLGFVVLPNTLIYTILLSLLYPVFDLLLVFHILLGSVEKVFLIYLLFTLVDLVYAAFAFTHEERRWILLLLPLQRIFYRFVIYVVIVKCIVKMVEGSEVVWGKVSRGREETITRPVDVGTFASRALRW